MYNLFNFFEKKIILNIFFLKKKRNVVLIDVTHFFSTIIFFGVLFHLYKYLKNLSDIFR